jgi:hypothetical protein
MIREVLDIYNRNILPILICCVTLVAPVTYFLLFAIEHIISLDTVEYTSLTALFLLVLNFSILFPPFFFITWQDLNDEQFALRDVFSTFVLQFGFVLIGTLSFYLIAIFGSVLFLIPTFVGIAMILLLPLFTERKSVKDSLKGLWSIVLSENIFILLDVVIIVCLNYLVWSGVTYIVADFENNQLVYVTLRAFVNALLFPLIYIYLTVKYRKAG